MNLLNTLMETCASLTQKVAHLEQDKVVQALEITKLKQRVKKLEKKRRTKHSGLKRLRKGRMEEDVTAVKEINAAESEPTVFNDEEVTMTMAQTLIKMKAKKTKLLDEQMANRLHDEEVEQAAARERQEQNDFKRAQELQQQYDQKQENIDWNVGVEQTQEKHLDNIRKYHNLKRKPISIAQARKNMIVYLRNMARTRLHILRWLSLKWKPYNSCTLSLTGKFTQKDQELTGKSLELVELYKLTRVLKIFSWANLLSPDRVFDFPVDELEPHPAYDFFASEPLPGYVEEDIAMLFRDVDFSNDEFEGDEEEEVGGLSTVAVKGQSFPFLAPRLPIPPSMIDKLSTRLGDLEYRHRQLVKKVIQVSNAEVAAGISISEIGPRVFAVEGQVQEAVQQRDTQIQFLYTMVLEMSNCKSTLMQCILGIDRQLADLERRPPGPQ
nr:hypothetical protein [Tanacetum cinerariifolium]